jgi:phytoene/squalene synthetase
MSGAATVESWSGKDRADENFPAGSLLIRRDLRAHVHAFYAFARNADDIADSTTLSADDKIARLDTMEDVLLDYCRYSAMPVGRHVLDLHGEDRATWEPSDALCTSLQVLNHLQDGAKDLAALDRCYLPADLLAGFGASVEDLRGAAATQGLRRVFDALLERVDALNVTAVELPRRTRSRRLRLETAVIVGLAQRLARRLHRDDPVARRVKLTKGDAAGSVLAALRYLP